jgi:hypothetical protein
MAKYIVQQGDCISSIAYEHGFFPDTLWNLSENAELKQKRKDPNILFSGDEVFIPDKREKTESGATEQKHQFKRKGVPSWLLIVLKDEESQPRAGLDYVLEIDGKLLQDKTNSSGQIRHSIPPSAQKGKITIGSGTQKEEYPLQIGHLDPMTEISGVQARLNNLGFNCGVVDGVLGTATSTAISKFQKQYGLQQSGEPDQTTRDKLAEVHGS